MICATSIEPPGQRNQHERSRMVARGHNVEDDSSTSSLLGCWVRAGKGWVG